MTEALELQRRWWLPDHEDHQVFGTLNWNADDGGTLHLQDELRPVVWLDNVLADGSVQKYRDDRGETQTYPLILGRVENRAYTLLDSFRLSVREYDMDEHVEKVHVNRFLEGAWFDDPDELSIDGLVAIANSTELRPIGTYLPRASVDLSEWLDDLPALAVPDMLVSASSAATLKAQR